MARETNLKAVKMTRKIRDALHEQLKDNTWEERVAFYKRKSRMLHKALKDRIGSSENFDLTLEDLEKMRQDESHEYSD